MNSIKTRETKGYANVVKCMRKVIERVAHLEKQKYFIIFLKTGLPIDASDIKKITEKIGNYELILMVETPELIINRCDGHYVVEMSNHEDICRILSDKTYSPPDSNPYLF